MMQQKCPAFSHPLSSRAGVRGSPTALTWSCTPDIESLAVRGSRRDSGFDLARSPHIYRELVINALNTFGEKTLGRKRSGRFDCVFIVSSAASGWKKEIR
ncbi:hypothetical protein RRG08_019771 [Elysia crispata]|uniref:Uncharacterized protein n=1 Tax=Elysia crispata TaxID=231223 RepID=A0AAE1AX91_9GAST|nr:hypothetical protein RRG08_019771 [Elysia crispata]